MPYYEYRCGVCEKRFTKFITYQDYGKVTVVCPFCASGEIKRRLSHVRFARSNDSRVDSFSDIDDLDALEENPQALSKMMRQMSNEVGEEMGPEFNEVVDRLEAGQSPEDIGNALPDYFGDSNGGSGDDSSAVDF